MEKLVKAIENGEKAIHRRIMTQMPPKNIGKNFEFSIFIYLKF